MTAEQGLSGPVCVCACVCLCLCACEYVCECVCLIEGLVDKLKSLLQMLSIPSVGDSVSFHPGQAGGKMNRDRRGLEWRDICMHTYTPSTHSSFLFCFSWSQRHTLFFLPLCFFYIHVRFVCVCLYLHMWVPVFLRCQSVCEGRGSFILVLKGWGGREVKLNLWLESMLIVRKEKDKERRRKRQSAMCLTALPRSSSSFSVYFYSFIFLQY